MYDGNAQEHLKMKDFEDIEKVKKIMDDIRKIFEEEMELWFENWIKKYHCQK